MNHQTSSVRVSYPLRHVAESGIHRTADSDVPRRREEARAAIINRIFAVKFFEPPSVELVSRLTWELQQMHVKIGVPLRYLGIIAPSSAVPSPEQRAALSDLGEAVSEFCASAYLVVEGDGFRQSIQRSVITAVHVIKGQRVRCHKHVSDAVTELSKEVAMLPNDLLAVVERSLDY